MATVSSHIEITPGVCGGRPRVAGHRIRVQDVAALHERSGFSPDEVVSMYPGLTLADVYAALAYYHEHIDEICRDLEADAALEAEVRASSPSRLAQKLMERHGGSSSVSR